jgi:hypothetical protein
MKNKLNLLPQILFIYFCFIFNFLQPAYSQDDFLDKYYFDYKVNPLPGGLNKVPVFNSNSPEIIRSEGILLSTFPAENRDFPDAHLNLPFKGNFDIFTHHIAVQRENGDFTNAYQGIIIQNPGSKDVTLKILAAATYTTRPDSPFFKLPDYMKNSEGNNFSGPGDRASQDILRGKSFLKNNLIRIKAGEYFVLMNEKIPISPLSAANGRTSMFKLDSDGPLYIADLALYEKSSLFLEEQKPELDEWLSILNTGNLAIQRDNIPSPLDPNYPGTFYYSRVSGVAIGNKWQSRITNDKEQLRIPPKNSGVAYGINTLFGNTYATSQVQSGSIERRYHDTALQAHGNYGVMYEIEIPLYNSNSEATSVSISFDSPLRFFKDRLQPKLSYYVYPPEKINFRGEFQLNYENFPGNEIEKFTHVIQRFGQQGLPLVSLLMEPGERRMVKIKFIYPSDSTPPHVLTITSN